jgi:hypothetical protein
MPEAIEDIRKAGVGPVDMQQSVIGPGMGVFTRYGKVLEDDDRAMSVKKVLSLINRVWEEIENELDANFDPETQVALALFANYGFGTRSSGELITLANAKNISLGALFSSRIFADLHGKAGLTKREGARAADAQKLAYRLYEIASQKKWRSFTMNSGPPNQPGEYRFGSTGGQTSFMLLRLWKKSRSPSQGHCSGRARLRRVPCVWRGRNLRRPHWACRQAVRAKGIRQHRAEERRSLRGYDLTSWPIQCEECCSTYR